MLNFIFKIIDLVLNYTYYALKFLINKLFLGLSLLYFKTVVYDWSYMQ